jgi:hypothetical protein
MIISVVNQDGTHNIFTDQKDDETFIKDIALAVNSGDGFSLNGPRGLIAYGPGTVARVVFVQDKEDKK